MPVISALDIVLFVNIGMIRPIRPSSHCPGNWWEFDREKEARCMKSVGLKTKGRHTCNKFELKI